MEIYLCWVLFGDTSGLSATNYKESSGWEFIPAGCSLGIPVLQLGQTPHMPGKFPVRAPDSEELLSSGNPLSDLSIIGVVGLQPQGPPGPSQVSYLQPQSTAGIKSRIGKGNLPAAGIKSSTGNYNINLNLHWYQVQNW